MATPKVATNKGKMSIQDRISFVFICIDLLLSALASSKIIETPY